MGLRPSRELRPYKRNLIVGLAVVATALFSCGCAGLKSRYAMDNPTYAEKYEVGAEKSDISGKLKQAMDARWVEGESGNYFVAGAMMSPESDNWLGTFAMGSETYPWSWVSTRLGVNGLVSDDGLYGGLDVGVGIQTPSRLAPFVGVGGTAGASVGDIIWSALTDEEDGIISSDEDVDWNGIAAVYPEVGAHFWLNGSLRLTLSGRYMVTSLGRRHDGWWIGGQIAKF